MLHTEKVTARIEVAPATRRASSSTISCFKDARWRYARMAGAKKVGFLAALESAPRKAAQETVEARQQRSLDRRRAPGRRRGDLRSARTGASRCTTRTRTGALAIKGSLFTLEVKDVDVPGGGGLRILGEKTGHGAAVRARPSRRGWRPPPTIPTASASTRRGSRRPLAHVAASGDIHRHLRHHAPRRSSPGIDFDRAHRATPRTPLNAIAAQPWAREPRARRGRRRRRPYAFQRSRSTAIAIDAEARGFDVKCGDIDVRKLGVPRRGRADARAASGSIGCRWRRPKAAAWRRRRRWIGCRPRRSVNATRFAARALLPPVARAVRGRHARRPAARARRPAGGRRRAGAQHAGHQARRGRRGARARSRCSRASRHAAARRDGRAARRRAARRRRAAAAARRAVDVGRHLSAEGRIAPVGSGRAPLAVAAAPGSDAARRAESRSNA